MSEEVTWQDQQQINTFSRLNSRSVFLRSLCKSRQTELDYHKDAISEMELMEDDELVKYKIGDGFVELKVEEARNQLEKAIEEFERDIGKDEEEIASLQTEMQSLKGALYGKFKGSINLEYDDE